MELNSFADPSRVHLVGACGSGMGALAAVLLDLGHRVSGSDLKDSAIAGALRRRGADIAIGPHRAENVPAGTAWIVASAAIPDSNPELETGRARGLPILRYAVALGAIMARRRGIAIAGTHGKSTTTAMAVTTLTLAGRDPGFVVGAEVPGFEFPGRGGRGEWFVAEACEYQRSFLALEYEIAAILNVEAEHLDYFGDFDGVRRAFREFVDRLPSRGHLVSSAEAAAVLGLHAHDSARARTLITAIDAAPGVGLHATSLRFDRGLARFSIGGEFEAPEIALAVPGRHFVEDALVAAGVAFLSGLDGDSVARGLAAYRGARRRLEVIRDDEVTALTDYAHHPTELDAVRDALRGRYPGRRLIAVFQPHQAARLLAFLPDFARALAPFDRVLVADVYRVRDRIEDVRAADSASLATAIEVAGGSALACGSAELTIARLGEEWRAGDVAILLGAGDIDDHRDAVATSLPIPHRR